MKRFISLILAIIMVVAMVPGMALAADAEETGSPYICGNPYWRTSYSTAVNAAPATKYNIGQRVFIFKCRSESARPTYDVLATDYQTSDLVAVTYEITVKADGIYTPSVTFAPSKYSPKFEVFITDYAPTAGHVAYYNDVRAFASEDKVGSFDAYSTANVLPDITAEDCLDNVSGDEPVEKTVKLLPQEFKAGKYYVTFVANGANENMQIVPEYWYKNSAGTMSDTYENVCTFYPISISWDVETETKKHQYNIDSKAIDTAQKYTSFGNNYAMCYSWVSKAEGKEPGIKSSYTDGFEMMNRIYNDGTISTGLVLNEDGFNQGLVIGDYTGNTTTANYVGAPTSDYVIAESNNWNSTEKPVKYGIRIKVDKSGMYKLSLQNNFSSSPNDSYNSNGEFVAGAVTWVTVAKVQPGDETLANVPLGQAQSMTDMNTAIEKGKIATLGAYDSRKLNTTTEYEDELNLEQGEYFVVFESNMDSLDATKGGNPNCWFRRIYTASTDTYSYKVNQLFLLSGITLTPVQSEEDKALAAEQAKYNDVKSDKENAIAEEVTETGLSDTSYVNIITASVDSADSTFEETTEKIEATRGEDVTVTAGTVEGYDFLYWRSGLGADAKVITNNPECTVKAVPGTWLTAVYKATSSEKVSVLFYNADGDIIENELVGKGTAITFPGIPVAPAGCGEFSGWALNTKENIVVSANATGNSMVFVAQYSDPAKNITVNVPEGATGGGSYAYGDEVTVTATERDNESKVFVYWKKGDEIVSFDKEYTFNAFENCELTAVYAEYKPVTEALRKIIIKGNVAEFIGLDSAVEKGVIFRDEDTTEVTLGNATHKIAMTTTGNHLSFNNDLTGSGKTNYIGYAILAGDKVIYDK